MTDDNAYGTIGIDDDGDGRVDDGNTKVDEDDSFDEQEQGDLDVDGGKPEFICPNLRSIQYFSLQALAIKHLC